MPDRLLTVRETRQRLRVSHSTLYAYLKSGRLQSVLLGPKSRRVRESDLDAFIASLTDRDGDAA